MKDFVYTTANKEQYLVLHGHKETKPTSPKFKKFYLRTRFFLGLVKLPFGKQIAKLFKMKSLLSHKKFKSWVSNFEHEWLDYLDELYNKEPVFHNFDGLICGHSHSPCRYNKNDKWFINIGDFVYSNSYLVETLEGGLELKSYNDIPLRYAPYD